MNVTEIKSTCDKILCRQLGKRLTTAWWNSPNHAFDNKTPAQQFATAPLGVLEYISTHLRR